MTRAGFLAAGATLAAPTLAELSPETRWTLTSAFQPGFDFLYGGAETFAAALSDMTDGQFTVKICPAGDIAGALDALDAVAEGKAECAHTALSYSWTKDPAYLFGSGAPFGMNARQHAAWLEIGGGNALIDGLLADRGLSAMPMGDTGGQMAGWFRKEVRNVGEFAGMKVRIGGFAGKVFETRGATVVSLPKDKIIEALANGTLDAFEWVGPYDDEKFEAGTTAGPGVISKVAPYYYYPGWWKGDMQLHLVVSKEKLSALPKPYQAALRAAAALANELGAGQIRRREPRRVEAAGGRRRAAAALPPGNSRSVLQHHERPVRQARSGESEVQGNLRLVLGVPRRRISVVAGRRIFIRQFHDPRASRQGLIPKRTQAKTRSS